MRESKFDTRSTTIFKGILIIFLLTHHLFNEASIITERNVISIFADAFTSQNVARYLRICVGGFAFLSAFGMNAKFRNIEDKNRNNKIFIICVKRYIKLMFSFEFVYIVALLFSKFVFKNSIVDIYGVDGKFKFTNLIFDALGMSNFLGTPTLNATWWYMSFAILLIFAIPILYLGYKKIGILMLSFFALIPMKLFEPNMEINVLLFPALLGIFCESENIFPRLKSIGAGKWYIKLVKFLICIALIFMTYRICLSLNFSILLYGISSILYTYICFEFIENIPVVSNILWLLGKNSMNIFFVHTFIYMYYFPDFIYSFKYDYLILLVLLIISLAVSQILEGLKILLRYHKLVNYCNCQVDFIAEKILLK